MKNSIGKFRRFALIVLFSIAPIAYADDYVDTVSTYIDAFNQQNIEEMVALSVPELRWMSVTGETLTVETRNHEELRSALTGYFASTASTKTVLRKAEASGQFVFTLEEAFWSVKGVEKSQCSMAIYQLLDNKISNVWYYPAHQC